MNWLSDPEMLPAVVPRARTMRYGYESQCFGDDAIRQKASTVAQRLLLSLKRKRNVSASISAKALRTHRRDIWWTQMKLDSQASPLDTANLSFANEKLTPVSSASQVKLLFACVD